ELVVKKSEGLFIYVKLVCEFLTYNHFTLNEAAEKIEKFKAGADGVYAAIGHATKKEVRRNVYYDVLGALLFASEPLTLQQLSFFADTSLEDTVAVFDKMRSILKSVDSKVSIVHKSVKDYFTSKQQCHPELHINMLDANALLAAKCLDVIAMYFAHIEDRVFPDNCGADVNAMESNGSTPLIYAAQNGHTETVDLLLSKGAHINATESDGSSSLMKASRKGYAKTVKLLLSKGADVNARNKVVWKLQLFYGVSHGWTALMYAAESGHTDIVITLLSEGADVNAQKSYGWTSLMLASKNGHTKTVEVL
ncbi:hypothetical protein HDU99_001493, partial [Rhizoclosmatium hyalinum]